MRGIDACEVCKEKGIISGAGQITNNSAEATFAFLNYPGTSFHLDFRKPKPSSSFLSLAADWIRGLPGMQLVRL